MRASANGGDLVERVEELLQRIAVAEPGDVRRDRRQHVVAGDQRAVFGVVQAEVIGRVPGRVDGDPLAAGELDGLGIVDPDASVEGCGTGAATARRACINAICVSGAFSCLSRPTAAGRRGLPAAGALRG